MNDSMVPYYKMWGYEAMARKFSISPDCLREFIRGDVIRTAAQYRLEASILQRQRVIQAWAEKVGYATWPMEISNYDNAGIPPSLMLV